VRRLEQELGVELLDRSPRSVELTVASAACSRGRDTCCGTEVAQRAARNAGDLARTRPRIGYLRDSLPTSVIAARDQP
jgi:DNA-binding transcriptional LysR family regulator